LSESYIARVNRWYDTDSSTNRRPGAFTATMPGLARSQMWGNTTVEPSRRRPIELGNQNAFVVAGLPERAADGLGERQRVAGRALAARVYCGVGDGRYRVRHSGLAEKPPPASTTPRPTRMRSSRPW
jgi:hypothetical protein